MLISSTSLDYLSNLVFGWHSPHWRVFYERLARSFRWIPGRKDVHPEEIDADKREQPPRESPSQPGASGSPFLGF